MREDDACELAKSGMQDETTVRTAFEAWFSDAGTWPAAVERSGDGYKLLAAQSAWTTWRAGWECGAANAVSSLSNSSHRGSNA